MSLKYLSNFCRSLEIPLINCNIEPKFKWTKHCGLAAAGDDNTNDSLRNIILTMKDKILYVPVVNLSKFKILGKGFERSVYWNEYITKSENKNTTNKYRYFLESNFVRVNRLLVLIYLNRNDDMKQFNPREFDLPKDII